MKGLKVGGAEEDMVRERWDEREERERERKRSMREPGSESK